MAYLSLGTLARHSLEEQRGGNGCSRTGKSLKIEIGGGGDGALPSAGSRRWGEVWLHCRAAVGSVVPQEPVWVERSISCTAESAAVILVQLCVSITLHSKPKAVALLLAILLQRSPKLAAGVGSTVGGLLPVAGHSEIGRTGGKPRQVGLSVSAT